MNIPKAVELAFAEVIREYAELGKDVTIRPYQSLEFDGSWKKEVDRAYPMVDIRCSPQKTNPDQHTFFFDCSILCGTKMDDDKSHAIVSALYDAIQEVCDALFRQFLTRTDGEELTDWKESITKNLPEAKFSFSGFTFGQSQPPFDDRGVNMIGITMVVHCGRPDF